jgi:hypothetical protein
MIIRVELFRLLQYVRVIMVTTPLSGLYKGNYTYTINYILVGLLCLLGLLRLSGRFTVYKGYCIINYGLLGLLGLLRLSGRFTVYKGYCIINYDLLALLHRL